MPAPILAAIGHVLNYRLASRVRIVYVVVFVVCIVLMILNFAYMPAYITLRIATLAAFADGVNAMREARRARK